MYVYPPAPPKPPAPPTSIEVGLCTFPLPPLPFELPSLVLELPIPDLTWLFEIDPSCPLNG